MIAAQPFFSLSLWRGDFSCPLSLWERVGVRVLQNLRDPENYRFCFLQNIVCPEAHHPISAPLQPSGPAVVITRGRGMLATIDFDDQPRLLAAEIGNERTDSMLTPEFQSRQLAVAKAGPEPAFRDRLVTT